MTITITYYGATYSVTLPKDANVDTVMRAVINLVASVGYPRESIVEMFKDGDPNGWDSAWETGEKAA